MIEIAYIAGGVLIGVVAVFLFIGWHFRNYRAF